VHRRVFRPLPVLTELSESVACHSGAALQRVLIVAVQHLLESTGSLFEQLLGLGLQPENLIVLGKFYSTCPTVVDELRSLGVCVVNSGVPLPGETFADSFTRDVERLWEVARTRVATDISIDTIVIMDDGGRAIKATPKRFSRCVGVIGIEQTTSGLAQKDAWPAIKVIEVAGSAIKRHVEPTLIADAVIAKVQAKLGTLEPTARCGVVGLGNVGAALGRALRADGYWVLGYDVRRADPSAPFEITDEFPVLVRECEYIFGCTGNDIFAGFEHLPRQVGGMKLLMSCSSEDAEFRALLAGAKKEYSGPLADVHVRRAESDWRIVRGGYPVNFDGSSISVPSEKIQLTRALLLAGVVQAVSCTRSPMPTPQGEKLWPRLQRFIFRTWLRQVGREACPETTAAFATDLQWLERESSGALAACPDLRP
jgi:hypothetical protein